MNDLKLKIALAYKVPRITKFIDEDIKQIKKLNNVFIRMERNNKEENIIEAINILKQLNNVFDINMLYCVICELVDIKFHSTIMFLYEKLEYSEKTVTKKLQELSKDEE